MPTLAHLCHVVLALAVTAPDGGGGAVSPSPATTQDAAQLASAVQRYYDGAKDLHARFEQNLTTAMGTKKRASGDLWLKKPGRMRWDYAKPEKKLMVADGQTLWVYEPEDEQAFKQELKSSNLPDSVADYTHLAGKSVRACFVAFCELASIKVEGRFNAPDEGI